MKLLLSLMLVSCIGCYECFYDTIKYRVESNVPVSIDYIPLDGTNSMQSIIPDSTPWRYSFEVYGNDPVYCGVIVDTLDGSYANMKVEIFANGELISGGFYRNTNTWTQKIYWCPPGCTSCAKVKLNVK